MKQIMLKFIPNLNRYTTEDISLQHLISDINIYPLDHPDYKSERNNRHITYERMIELQPIAMDNGYLFVY
jgi:hypothetical protein